MKRFLALALLAGVSACGLYAQVVDTTVCDIIKKPQAFDGKIVRIKGTVAAGFDQFVIKDTDCGAQVNAIWLSYPQGAKGKAGAVAVVELQPAHNYSGTLPTEARKPVSFEKSKDFKQFDSLLSAPHNKGVGMCLGCTRYEVNATLVGRLDGVADATIKHDAAGKIVGLGGFGNMNAYNARMVLQSVSDVSPKEVDFAKSDAATKGELTVFKGNGDLYDPVVAARKSALLLGHSNAGTQAELDAAAFPKPGEHNGVSIVYGATNEASAKDDTPGKQDSPDGVLFNCLFNLDRLEGDALVRAIIHMGQHISDLRNPAAQNKGAGPYLMEYDAWAITTATAMANGQKFLTLPGGYMLWNSTWPAEDRTKNLDTAITGFLSAEELLSK